MKDLLISPRNVKNTEAMKRGQLVPCSSYQVQSHGRRMQLYLVE